MATQPGLGNRPSLYSRAKDAFLILIDPWFFMSASLSFLPGTISTLLKRRDYATIFSWSKLQSRWFGRFWAWAGPQVRSKAETRVVPLLEGRVRKGQILEGDDAQTADHESIKGTVIEIGAGSGMWVSLFASAAKEGRVTKVYGVEPNEESHLALLQRVREAGLQDVYEAVPVGIEEMAGGAAASKKWDGRIEPESIDSIVSILCLCSIPEPEKNIGLLYGYLKKGGNWYVFEHIRCQRRHGLGMIWYQWFVNLFWPQCIGACQLTRDTHKTLLNAGPWASIDIEQPPGESPYSCIPHVLGVLTK